MKLYCMLLCLLMATACVQPGGRSSLTNPNIQVVNGMFAAFNEHDWQKMASYYADSALFLDPAYGHEPVTLARRQMIEKYQELHKMFPDVQDEVKEIYADKNHIIVEFVSSTTGQDGKKWQLPLCVVFTIEHGKIISDRTYYDQE